MNEEEAVHIAQSVLSDRFEAFARGDWVICNVQEYESAWAVNYDGRKYVETGEIRGALGGNGALVVPKSGAEPWFTWSGDTTANQVALGRSTLADRLRS
jgi:hypothetical protein